MRVLVSVAALIACSANAQDLTDVATKAPAEAFTETRYGQTIDDPYRWMEDQSRKDDLAKFVHEQSNLAVAKLGALPQRAEYAKIIDSAIRAGAQVSTIRVAGSYTFWRQLDPNDRLAKLMVRSAAGTRILFDPAKEPASAAGPAAVNGYSVSPDGKTVALHVSFGGAEIGAIRFIESDTGRETLSRLAPVWSEFQAQWLTADKVIFTRLPDQLINNDPFLGMVAVVGKPGGTFTPILGPDVAGGPEFSPTSFPLVKVSVLSDWVIGLADNVIDPAVFLARRTDLAAGKPAWRKFAESSDKIVSFTVKGDALYMISTRDVSDGQIVRFSAAGGAGQIVPTPKGQVLTGIVAARDGLYLSSRRDGISHLFWMPGGKGPAKEIPLPFEADLNGFSFVPIADGSGASFMLAGWTTAPRGYVVRAGKLSAAGVESTTWPGASGLMAHRETARSADGTMVPMVIVDRAGADKIRPALIEAYGSYGASTATPSYEPYSLAWSARGNSMVYCGTRGGSERGRAWHDGGRRENKPNAHADLVACAERLIELGISAPKRIAITGTSAGGLLAPVVAEKRPDLFGALVARVAIMNATRLEVAENGANNFVEMGDPRTEAGWRALAAQDAYLGLPNAVDLPDTLLTIGLNDHRVSPWMSAKFAARAQAKFGDKRQILIRTEKEGGHGSGSARDLQVQEFADIFAFLEDRLAAGKTSSSTTTDPEHSVENPGK